MSKRQRGVVLTDRGLERIETAIAAAQEATHRDKRFPKEEIAARAQTTTKTLNKIFDRALGVDKSKLRDLFQAFGLALDTADYGPLDPVTAIAPSPENSPPSNQPATKIDWGEKPDTKMFFGRVEELATLRDWVMVEQCRVVTLLGMGGIGKTSLAAKLADQIYDQFDYVIWRSLREAPPLDEILVRLIQFLSDQQETEINLPARLGERLIRLLHYLREHRCLLVLDNLESILQAESTGQFRDGYEGYGELIRRIGEAEHQSCLLLTSRECPRELAPMAGDRLPVRLWSVTGIDPAAGREILQTKGLELDEANPQSQELIDRYSGNPQALHLVATAIQREFLGDVDDFLEEEGAAVEDVRTLLDQHLTRLVPLERSILFWLAINREPVGLDELMEDLLPPVTKREVRSALRGLSDRYLIEAIGKQFTLQNVIMEFVTDRFVEQVSAELQTQQFDLFHTHALIKATAKDYVRETQVRLLLHPVADLIHNLEQKVDDFLKTIRQHSAWPNGYAAGSLLNLLCQVHSKVEHVDFSGFTLRQSHLAGMQLIKLRMQNIRFVRSSLTHSFGGVQAIAFSPNGEIIATGDSGGNIHLWNARDQKFMGILSGHTNRVWSVVFSPDGRLLASSGEDFEIRLWSLEDFSSVYSFREHTGTVWSVAFSPDSSMIASSCSDHSFLFWYLNIFCCVHSFREHTGTVWSVAFSPDGATLASSGEDFTIRLWDVKKLLYLYSFTGHTNWVRSVSFSPDGHVLASSSGDSTVRLWDIKTCQCLNTFLGHNNRVRTVAFSPDGQTIASGGGDSTFRLWNSRTYECLKVISGHTSWAWSVAFSPDGKVLASDSGDRTVRLWNLQSKKSFHAFSGHDNWIWSVAFSPDGKLLASGSGDSTIRLWNTQTCQYIGMFIGHENRVRSIAFSPDGKLLASGSGDSTIRLWYV